MSSKAPDDAWTAAQASAARSMYRLSNLALRGLSRLFWGGSRPSSADRICIHRIGNIGDIVCAIPAMTAIRAAYPQAHMTLLTSSSGHGAAAEELLTGATWLDEILVYPADDPLSQLRFAASLRARHFDLWFELPDSLMRQRSALKTMTMALLSGAKRASGWRISTIRWFGRAQSQMLEFPDEVDRLLRVLEDDGLKLDIPPYPILPAAAEKLESSGGAPVVALAPGARRPTNVWPEDRFAAVGRHFASKGCRVLVLGGESDEPLCRKVAEDIGAAAACWAGRASVLQSCDVLRRCALLVSNDSGLQHAAAALGVPSVSIFSSWQLKGTWYPHGRKNVVLQKSVPCGSCFYFNCPYDNLCVKLVDAQEVIAAAESLLAGAHDDAG